MEVRNIRISFKNDKRSNHAEERHGTGINNVAQNSEQQSSGRDLSRSTWSSQMKRVGPTGMTHGTIGSSRNSGDAVCH